MSMTIDEFQERIREIYFDKDNARGKEATFLWFVEEVGELAAAIREGSQEELEEEFADVFAWMVTLANLTNVRLSRAIAKYAKVCPGCGTSPCSCGEDVKP